MESGFTHTCTEETKRRTSLVSIMSLCFGFLDSSRAWWCIWWIRSRFQWKLQSNGLRLSNRSSKTKEHKEMERERERGRRRRDDMFVWEDIISASANTQSNCRFASGLVAIFVWARCCFTAARRFFSSFSCCILNLSASAFSFIWRRRYPTIFVAWCDCACWGTADMSAQSETPNGAQMILLSI